MELKHKIRAMRKVVKRQQDAREEGYEDMRLWSAPSECGGVIEKTFRRHIDNGFKQLGLTEAEYMEEMNKYIEAEGKFCGEHPPIAFIDILIN